MDPSLWYQNPWNNPSNSPQQWGEANLFTTNYFSSMPPSVENPNSVHPAFTSIPTYCSFGLSPQGQYRLSPRSQYRVKSRKNSKPSAEIPVKIGDLEVKVNWKVKAKRSSRRRQQMSEATAAAVKIQKAFRGFSLRRTEPLKNLKKIAEVKAILDGFRKRINDQEFVEFIRLNEEEGVKVLVRIVSLLLRLDLIKAVNTFVRESRKAMVLEIMKLKEEVDAIVRETPIEAEAESSDVVLKIMKIQKIADAIVSKKPNEAEAESTKNDEKFTLPKEMIPLDLQAAWSNVSPPCTHLNSTGKKIMLCHKQSCECLNDLSEHVKDTFDNVLEDEQSQANNGHNKEDAHSIECFSEIGMVTQDVSKLQTHGTFKADLDVGKIKDEGDSHDWEFLEKPEDESVDMTEELRGENKLKKFAEELCSRDKIQIDIIEDVSKMFKKLQKMMLRSAEDKTNSSLDNTE